jgi:hypothetical protein
MDTNLHEFTRIQSEPFVFIREDSWPFVSIRVPPPVITRPSRRQQLPLECDQSERELLMRRMLLAVVVIWFSCTSAARAYSPVLDKVMQEQADRIPVEAMKKAFDYFEAHPDQIKNKNYITIVDFNRASTEKRMHVINVKTGEVEDLLVAHGRNSGENCASSFSNENGTLKSSLGVYLTAEEYVGKHGLSMRLDGMETTNSNVRKRDIVLHGADYVSEATIKATGRLGRSWGCPAVPMEAINRLVKQLEGKSVLLIYRGTGPEAKRDVAAATSGPSKADE